MEHCALLIEDNPVLQNIYRIALERLGCRAIIIEDGDTASEWIKQPAETPLFIIVDLALPGKSGEILLEEIKDQPALKDVTVIVVTANEKRANTLREAKARGENVCAEKIITKPFNYDDLFDFAKLLMDQ